MYINALNDRVFLENFTIYVIIIYVTVFRVNNLHIRADDELRLVEDDIYRDTRRIGVKEI